MRTINYIEVQNGLCELAFGTSTDQPLATEFPRLRRLISKRLSTAWEYSRWPELGRLEQRTYRLEWASGTTYAATSEVFYTPTLTYYQSLRSNAGNVPATLSGSTYTENSAYWAECRSSYSPNRGPWVTATAYAVGDQVYYQPTNLHYQCYTAHTSSGTLVPNATGGNARWGVLTPFDRYVGYTQTGQTKIGSVFSVNQNNPRVVCNANAVPFQLSANGVQVVNGPAQVWLDFRTRTPYLKGTVYSATATYAVDDQIYFSSATVPGNFYDCIVATTAGQSPSTTAASWSVVEIPLVFERYLIQGAYADWLKGEGETDKWVLEDAIAARLLADQKLLLCGQQGQRPRTVVQTR